MRIELTTTIVVHQFHYFGRKCLIFEFFTNFFIFNFCFVTALARLSAFFCLAVFGQGHQGSSVVLGTVCVQVRTLLVHTPDNHTAFLLSWHLVTRPS